MGDEPKLKLRSDSIAYVLSKTSGFLEYHPQLSTYQNLGVPSDLTQFNLFHTEVFLITSNLVHSAYSEPLLLLLSESLWLH